MDSGLESGVKISGRRTPSVVEMEDAALPRRCSASSLEGSKPEAAAPQPALVPDLTVSAPSLPPPPPPASDANTTYPEGGTAAYLVVLGSLCGMTTAFGILNTVGVFQTYLSAHQLAAYTADEIGWIFSLGTFMAFFGGVQVGPVFDRWGPRALVAVGSIIMLGGVLGLGESTEYWHFILSFSIAVGLGASLIFTPAIASIGHYFLVHRGAATGLAATGGSIGGIVFPLMLPPLIDSVGYRWAIRILALILACLCVVANLLIRSRLPPTVPAPTILPSPRIFRSWAFSLTTAGVFMIEWGLFVPITFLPSTAIRSGIPASLAYTLLSVLNAGSFFGRWIPGYVADRVGRFNAMIVTIVLVLLSILCFWLPAVTLQSSATIPLTILFALTFGFASGSNISLTPVCVGQLCDTREYGRYYAGCYVVVSFGCLTGVPIAGVLEKGVGDVGVVAFTGACYLAGLACFVVTRVGKVGWGFRKRF